MRLEEAERQADLGGESVQLADLVEDQAFDLGGGRGPLATAEPLAIGIARVRTDADASGLRQAQRVEDGRAIAGVGAAADAGGGDAIHELRVVRGPLAEVGVQVDRAWLRAGHRSSPRLASNSSASIGTKRSRSPARIGKWPFAGSTMRSGVLPSSRHPPGDAFG